MSEPTLQVAGPALLTETNENPAVRTDPRAGARVSVADEPLLGGTMTGEKRGQLGTSFALGVLRPLAVGSGRVMHREVTCPPTPDLLPVPVT